MIYQFRVPPMNSGNENVGEATIALHCPLSPEHQLRHPDILTLESVSRGEVLNLKGHTSGFKDQKLQSKSAPVHGFAPSAFVSRSTNPPLPVLVRILQESQRYITHGSSLGKPTLKRPCTSVWVVMSGTSSRRRTTTHRGKNWIVSGP